MARDSPDGRPRPGSFHHYTRSLQKLRQRIDDKLKQKEPPPVYSWQPHTSDDSGRVQQASPRSPTRSLPPERKNSTPPPPRITPSTTPAPPPTTPCPVPSRPLTPVSSSSFMYLDAISTSSTSSKEAMLSVPSDAVFATHTPPPPTPANPPHDSPLRGTVTSLMDELKKSNAMILDLKDELEGKVKENLSLRGEAEEMLAKLDELDTAYCQVVREHEELKCGRVRELEQQLEEAEETIRDLDQSARKAIALREAHHEASKGEMLEVFKHLQEQLHSKAQGAAPREDRGKLSRDDGRKNSEGDKRDKEIRAMQKKLALSTEEKAKAENEVADLRRAVEEARRQHRTAEARYNEVMDEMHLMKDEYETSLATHKHTIGSLREALAAAHEQIEDLEEQLAASAATCASAEEEMAAMQEKLLRDEEGREEAEAAAEEREAVLRKEVAALRERLAGRAPDGSAESAQRLKDRLAHLEATHVILEQRADEADRLRDALRSAEAARAEAERRMGKEGEGVLAQVAAALKAAVEHATCEGPPDGTPPIALAVMVGNTMASLAAERDTALEQLKQVKAGYDDLSDELRDLEGKLVHAASGQVAEAERAVERERKARGEVDELATRLRRELEAERAAREVLERETKGTVEDLEEKVGELEEKVHRLSSEKLSLEDEVQRVRADLQAAQARAVEAETSNAKCLDDAKALRRNLLAKVSAVREEERQASLAALDELNALIDRNRQLSQVNAALSADLTALRSKLTEQTASHDDTVRGLRDQLKTEKASRSDEAKAHAAEIERMLTQKDEAMASLVAAREHVGRLQEEVRFLKGCADEARQRQSHPAEVMALTTQKDLLQKELDSARSQVADLRQQLQKSRVQRQKLQSENSELCTQICNTRKEAQLTHEAWHMEVDKWRRKLVSDAADARRM